MEKERDIVCLERGVQFLSSRRDGSVKAGAAGTWCTGQAGGADLFTPHWEVGAFSTRGQGASEQREHGGTWLDFCIQ